MLPQCQELTTTIKPQHHLPTGSGCVLAWQTLASQTPDFILTTDSRNPSIESKKLHLSCILNILPGTESSKEENYINLVIFDFIWLSLNLNIIQIKNSCWWFLFCILSWFVFQYVGCVKILMSVKAVSLEDRGNIIKYVVCYLNNWNILSSAFSRMWNIWMPCFVDWYIPHTEKSNISIIIFQDCWRINGLSTSTLVALHPKTTWI